MLHTRCRSGEGSRALHRLTRSQGGLRAGDVSRDDLVVGDCDTGERHVARVLDLVGDRHRRTGRNGHTRCGVRVIAVDLLDDADVRVRGNTGVGRVGVADLASVRVGAFDRADVRVLHTRSRSREAGRACHTFTRSQRGLRAGDVGRGDLVVGDGHVRERHVAVVGDLVSDRHRRAGSDVHTGSGVRVITVDLLDDGDAGVAGRALDRVEDHVEARRVRGRVGVAHSQVHRVRGRAGNCAVVVNDSVEADLDGVLVHGDGDVGGEQGGTVEGDDDVVDRAGHVRQCRDVDGSAGRECLVFPARNDHAVLDGLDVNGAGRGGAREGQRGEALHAAVAAPLRSVRGDRNGRGGAVTSSRTCGRVKGVQLACVTDDPHARRQQVVSGDTVGLEVGHAANHRCDTCGPEVGAGRAAVEAEDRRAGRVAGAKVFARARGVGPELRAANVLDTTER